MGGGYQGDSQADDIASPIKLDIWWELGRRCSSSSWLTWSEARRAAGATGLPRVTCCRMGRQRSSCSQRSCSDRRSAIVSSDGCGIRPLPSFFALAFLLSTIEEELALRSALS